MTTLNEELPSSGEENAEERPEVTKRLRTTAKSKFTRLLATISTHIEGEGESSVLVVHAANLDELYEECKSLHSAYVKKTKPDEEGLEKAEKWGTALDKAFSDSKESFLAQERRPTRSTRRIEAEIQARKRKMEEDLEDSKIAEERRVSDIRRKAAREAREMELELEAAQAFERGPTRHSTPLKQTAGPSYSNIHPPDEDSTLNGSRLNTPATPPTAPIHKPRLDNWIYEPFTPVLPGAEGQQLVTMAMLPNLPQFSGDPREWPMFIQSFKSMVHDVFTSDAQHLAMLHSRLATRLREGMSQVLTAPTAYREALQELHRKYGHPHLVVRSYIQWLMELPSIREGKEVDTFSSKLHGAVATLEAAGYGHELNSSVALNEIIAKLPHSMIARWGRRVNRLLPRTPTLRDLDAWVEEEMMSTKNVREVKVGNPNPRRLWNMPPRRAMQPFQPSINFIDETKRTDLNDKSETTNNKCAVCETTPGHRLALCPKFVAMEPTQRAQVVFDIGNCFRCLGRNHSSNECRKTDVTCGMRGCNQHHHILLHGANRVAKK